MQWKGPGVYRLMSVFDFDHMETSGNVSEGNFNELA